MLIKINAIVREEKFEDVKEALNKIGVNGITVSGYGMRSTERFYRSYPWNKS